MTSSTQTAPTAGATSIFCCDHCDHEMMVKSELAGRKARCPKCGQTGRVASGTPIHHPAPVPVPAPAAPAPVSVPHHRKPEATTRCPFCREEILAVARKCKHCGEFLDDTQEIRERNEQTFGFHHNQSGGGQPLPRWVIPAVAAVGVIILAVGGWYMFKGGQATTGPGASATPKPAAVATPAFELTAASMQKALAGTAAKGLAGATTKFLPADGAAWKSAISNTDGKTAHATLEVPYSTSVGASAAGTRGVLHLDFTSTGGAWQFQSVSRQPLVSIAAGKEKEIPDEDRQTLRLPDSDYVVVHVRTVGLKMKPPRIDD